MEAGGGAALSVDNHRSVDAVCIHLIREGQGEGMRSVLARPSHVLCRRATLRLIPPGELNVRLQ